MLRGLLLLVAAACLLAVSGGASASGAKRGDCTWGASSMTASYVDGQLVESQPQTSGCIP